MKRFLLGIIIGAALGAWGYATYKQQQNRAPVDKAKQSVSSSAERVKEVLQEKLDPQDIKKELERTSTVVREKARKTGAAISDVASDTRITAAIKSKLAAESALSVFSIKVETTDGLVTLSGTVDSHDQIGRAVKLALDTEGVVKVVSTLQVKPAK